MMSFDSLENCDLNLHRLKNLFGLVCMKSLNNKRCFKVFFLIDLRYY